MGDRPQSLEEALPEVAEEEEGQGEDPNSARLLEEAGGQGRGQAPKKVEGGW